MPFVWVALYGLTHKLSEGLSRHFALGSWSVAAAMALYTAALVGWLLRTGRAGPVGLRVPRLCCPPLCLAPLALMPALNLILTAGSGAAVGLSALLTALCVAAVEEIFFRGFLLSFFGRRGLLPGALLSSALFAAMHLANLFSDFDRSYVLLQVLCAGASGLLYCGVAAASKSLLPCIAAHFLTNATAFGASHDAAAPWLICVGIYIVYGIWLCRKISATQRRIYHETLH